MEQETHHQFQYTAGILGIIKESCNQNSSSSSSPTPRKKIFLHITLTLILPLWFMRLAHRKISEILYRNLALDSNPERGVSTMFLTSDFAYFNVLVILGLLSTSVVVYAAACIWAAKVISFEKVMTNIVPKVWKRVTVTFIRNFIILVAYNIVSLVVPMAILILEYFAFSSTIRYVVVTLLIAAYVLGLICLTVIGHSTTVVTVLEESNGIIQALLHHKSGSLASVFVSFIFVLSAIQLIIVFSVVEGGDKTINNGLGRIMSGALSLVLMSALMLFVLIVQTVIYFICVSYLLDKSLMDDHGDDASLKKSSSKDGVQLQQFDEGV